MGQYYQPVIEMDGKITVYNRDIDGEYTMAKLTEHSWWKNPLMIAISEMFYQKQGRLIWCGDYAEDDEVRYTNMTVKEIWDKGAGLKATNFNFDNLYLCNHERKQYLDLAKYKKKSTDKDGWCLHPLSLLTAVGNGRGGGDYHDCYPNFNKIGIWAWDMISLEETIPEGYVEFNVVFKER